MSQNAIVKYEAPAPLSIQDASQMGQIFAKSGFFADAREAAQCITKIMAGAELGLPPIQSLTGINLIKGRVSLGANVIASLIKRSGKYDYRVREHTDQVCRIDFYQGSECIGKSEFTAADAKKAGTQNMDRFPRNMLFARAISNGAKWYCADVFGGPVYTPEELGAKVDEEGHVIEPPKPEPAPVQVVAVEPTTKLDTKAEQRQKARRMALALMDEALADHYTEKLGVSASEDAIADAIIADVKALGLRLTTCTAAQLFGALHPEASLDDAAPEEAMADAMLESA